MRIGVDLMGSESSPQELFQAVLEAQEELKGIGTLVAFATPPIVKKLTKLGPHINFIAAPEVIAMDDTPLYAVRRKKQASMLVGMRMLAEKEIDAFVSAGNTGALVIGAWLNMPLLPGITRPALLALLPTQKGSVAIIDVGGNVENKAEHLVQFAKMGVAFQSCGSKKKTMPTVGLLNIGIESAKGAPEVRKAYKLLKAIEKEKKLHFIGNIEGRDVFEGKVDVLVTDGFTGNILLKTSEGISQFIHDLIKVELKSHKISQTDQILQKLQGMINYDEYPGAVLCGIDGIVIKCHGYASSKGLLNGIKGAVSLLQNKLIDKLKKSLKKQEIV